MVVGWNLPLCPLSAEENYEIESDVHNWPACQWAGFSEEKLYMRARKTKCLGRYKYAGVSLVTFSRPSLGSWVVAWVGSSF